MYLNSELTLHLPLAGPMDKTFCRKTLFRTVLCACVIMSAACSMIGEKGKGEDAGPYVWKNVRISGGGFVTGIVFHPTVPGLRYCRTDMGGAYRWNAELEMWEPLLDWLPYDDRNLMGVESIALDPSDPNRLYMACGTYTHPGAPDGAILWSADRGKTFRRTDLPFKLGANENGRGNGERMAVDPLNGNILYLGTRHDGLWCSCDRALTWTKVESFPDIKEKMPEPAGGRERWQQMQEMGCGIVFVVFDPSGRTTGGSGGGTRFKGSRKSRVIYAGASLMGREHLFRSEDGGGTWKAVPGQPVDYRPTHGILTPDGIMYLSYGTNPGPWPMRNGAVWKLDTKTDTWTDITPDRPDPGRGRAFGYAAVAADASNPDVLITSSYHRYSAGGEELFRSTDGGENWTPVFASGAEFDYSKAPYIRHTGIHWMFDVEIDPANPDHALITAGYGGHETFNLSAVDRGEPVLWQVMSSGIEETVPLDLLSPPAIPDTVNTSGQLITAVGDYCGFMHRDLDRPVPEGCFINPHFGNTNSLACAWLRPEMIVRTGVEHVQVPVHNIGYSLDGGRTWQPTPTMPFPEARHGHVSVSADGGTWIWTPELSRPWLTEDRGTTWEVQEDLPENTEVIADRVDPRIFYAMRLFDGKFYRSADGGHTFDSIPLEIPGGIPENRSGRGDDRGGQDRVYATPGRSGDLWIAAFHGLFHSEDSGETFTRMPAVDEVHAFGFGAPAPLQDRAATGTEIPALYLIGTVNGIRGIFRSDDFAGSWLRINDDQHQWGLLLQITGDPKKYGRVYIGTHGRGAIYGDPRP